MTSQIGEELLVAYVDGELDAAAVRQVEAALATDADARQSCGKVRPCCVAPSRASPRPRFQGRCSPPSRERWKTDGAGRVGTCRWRWRPRSSPWRSVYRA